MTFIDTGYLVALIDRRDQLHARATAWSRHLHDSLVTTSAVLLETFNNLSDTPLRMHPHKLLNTPAHSTLFEIIQITRQNV